MAYFRTHEFAPRLSEAPRTFPCDARKPTQAIGGFAATGTAVPSSERKKINAIAVRILTGQADKIQIVGHADADDGGDPAVNHQLGLDRANAVLQALRTLVGDIPLDKLESRGASCPIASGSDEASRQQNRRVDVFVLVRIKPIVPPPPSPHPPHPPQRPPSGPGLDLERLSRRFRNERA